MIGRIFIFAGVLMMLIGLAAHIHHESKLYDARMNHNEIQLERVLGEMEYPIDVIKAPNQFPHFEHSYLLIDLHSESVYPIRSERSVEMFLLHFPLFLPCLHYHQDLIQFFHFLSVFRL